MPKLRWRKDPGLRRRKDAGLAPLLPTGSQPLDSNRILRSRSQEVFCYQRGL